jgi:TolA-binding protein
MAWARCGRASRIWLACSLVSAALLFFPDLSPAAQGGSGAGSGGAPRGGQARFGGRPPIGIVINENFTPETGEMDPRLPEAMNVFGAGRYDDCRRLAQALLAAEDAASCRPDAVALIIYSHLHQGDFPAARSAADRLRSVSPDVCEDLLAQVNREERDYQAEVGRLQRIVATTTDPEEAARAQLWTAHAHQRVGRLEVAEGSYRKVVECYPTSPSAPRALAQIAMMAAERGQLEAAERTWWDVIQHFPTSPQAAGAIGRIASRLRRGGDEAGARAACEKVIALAPDSPAAASACEVIYAPLLPPGAPGELPVVHSLPVPGASYEAARQRLLDDYPASESAAHAALQLGDHYLAARKPEEAIRAYMHARRAPQHLSPEQRASAMVGLGQALERLGRSDEAAYEYRAAMALAPNSPAAYQAARALDRLQSPP